MGYSLSVALLVAGLTCCLVSFLTEAACITVNTNVKCTSWMYKRSACRVPGTVTATRLKAQISKTPCRKNINYGYQDNDIWVDYGCRGVFTVSYCKLVTVSSSRSSSSGGATTVLTHSTTSATNTYVNQSQTTNTGNSERSAGLEDNDNGLIVALSTVIPLVIILIASAVILWRLRKQPHIHTCSRKFKSLIKMNKATKEPPGTVGFSPVLQAILCPETLIKLKPLIHDTEQLEIQEVLCKGAFGSVLRGVLHGQDGAAKSRKLVAIKTIADNCIGSDITAFVNEAITMADLQHPHLLSIIGVCIDSKTEIPMIILPYMANGDLRTYLRALRRDAKDDKTTDPDERQLLLLCLHISRGMEYLSEQRIIHRDLAARNCMLDSDLTVKVADFGLARDVYSDSYYRQDKQKRLPVRWMAMECLQDHVFTLQCDIWAFGVTMWEVFSMGRVPYMHLDNAHIAAHLEAGNRLEQPDICPTEMYGLMTGCFVEAPDKRPSFTEISRRISNSLATVCGYVDLTPEISLAENNDDYSIEYLDHLSASVDIPEDDGDEDAGYEDVPIPYDSLKYVDH